MKKKLLVAGMSIGLFTSCVSGNAVFVAPGGSDSNPGTLEKPLKSVSTAIIKTRTFNKEKPDIVLRGGTYYLKETVLIKPEDSGLTITAYKNEKPVLSGAVKIENWKKLTGKVKNLNPKAAGKIWYADIEKGVLPHFMYINGSMVQRSRWLNTEKWRTWAKDHKIGKPEKNGQLITFTKNGEILKHLPDNGDCEMVCIVAQYGVMGNGVVKNIDTKKNTLRWNSRQLKLRRSRNSHERGYNFENALYLIDEPGEWAADSATGRIYYWPKKGEALNKDQVLVSKLYEIIRIAGTDENPVKNITLDGLTLQYSDRLPEDQWPYTWLMRQWENVDGTLYMTGVDSCTVKNCRILNSGAYGIVLNHYAQNNKILHNEIGWTGSGGIFLEGYGPGKLDVNKNNIVSYNYIHRHGLANYWHSPSIQIYQSGHNQITYNLMKDSAYSGISMVGMNPIYMNQIKMMEPGHFDGLWQWWNYFCPRLQDFPENIQKNLKKGKYRFNRETMKPYMHSRENNISCNLIVEPHSLLNEGGAIYAWCPGKNNVWKKNIIYVSHAMPGSSVLAMDDLAEYFTVTDNVFWVNGNILNGVGARPTERGIVAKNNYRVMFKPEFKARQRGKLGKWWTNDKGRKPLDKLFDEILTSVVDSKWKNWPGNPSVGIPGLDKVTKAVKGKREELPEGSHVTIE